MNVAEMLAVVHDDWMEVALEGLSQTVATREGLRPQLERFFELLQQTAASHDAVWMDSVIYLWVWSQTSTDLDSEHTSVVGVLQRLLGITLQVAARHFPPEEVLGAAEELLQYWSHMLEYATEQEIRARLDHTTAELERAQRELERLDKSKSDFISVAAHELKTPLTLVEGYAAMLRDTLTSADKGVALQAQPFLEGIFRGSKRIRAIVDDLVDVSLLDNDMLKLSFQPLWLGQIFRSLADELAPVLAERRLTLKIHHFPGSDRVLFGDVERLQQVFRNLLTNAIKYTPDGGKITVDGRLLEGFVEVLVMDTGIGIDPADQRIIFDKFGRLGNPLTHSSGKTRFKGGGPGLGLAIAKGIVEAHGGSIWVESPGYDEEKCPGSTFHVLLPLREAPPEDGGKESIFAKLAAYIKKGE